jgi:hypothetical protein
LDKTVARLNIEHYRKKLTEEKDPDRRNTLLRLIAEEEARLHSLENKVKDRKK